MPADTCINKLGHLRCKDFTKAHMVGANHSSIFLKYNLSNCKIVLKKMFSLLIIDFIHVQYFLFLNRLCFFTTPQECYHWHVQRHHSPPQSIHYSPIPYTHSRLVKITMCKNLFKKFSDKPHMLQEALISKGFEKN